MRILPVILAAATLAMAPFAIQAKKPHPTNAYTDALVGNVECICDFAADPGTCTVTWPDVDAPTYGASIEIEVSWMDNGVEMSGSEDLSLDDLWSCDTGTCTATKEFQLTDITGVEARAAVKGFDNTLKDRKSRDFEKARADCSSLEVI